jgi:hypothetical protein
MNDINKLVGETLVSIEGAEPDSENITLKTASGKTFLMFHSQD